MDNVKKKIIELINELDDYRLLKLIYLYANSLKKNK